MNQQHLNLPGAHLLYERLHFGKGRRFGAHYRLPRGWRGQRQAPWASGCAGQQVQSLYGGQGLRAAVDARQRTTGNGQGPVGRGKGVGQVGQFLGRNVAGGSHAQYIHVADQGLCLGNPRCRTEVLGGDNLQQRSGDQSLGTGADGEPVVSHSGIDRHARLQMHQVAPLAQRLASELAKLHPVAHGRQPGPHQVSAEGKDDVGLGQVVDGQGCLAE